MEKVLSNQEFNSLLKEVKLEKTGLKSLAGDAAKSVDDILAKLKVYWKLAKPVLKVAKLITSPKVDKGIDEFIAIVNRLCDGTTGEEQSELLEKFAIAWKVVEPILEGVKGITPPKADAIIDEVIKIGNLLQNQKVAVS